MGHICKKEGESFQKKVFPLRLLKNTLIIRDTDLVDRDAYGI